MKCHSFLARYLCYFGVREDVKDPINGTACLEYESIRGDPDVYKEVDLDYSGKQYAEREVEKSTVCRSYFSFDSVRSLCIACLLDYPDLP